MKKAREIREDLFGSQLSLFTWSDIEMAIKLAQIDTIKETVKRCVKNVKTKMVDGGWQGCSTSYPAIDKQSILDIENELMLEL